MDPKAAVTFDLDGSGRKTRWGWITPKAGWLVYDSDESGRIKSGLQLFGSVTFWIFWENGYEALACLDDDQNGMIEGPELTHLAVWCDANSNGVSDPGEVIPLAELDIVALRLEYEAAEAGLISRGGVIFSNGVSSPSYDWMAPENCGK